MVPAWSGFRTTSAQRLGEPQGPVAVAEVKKGPDSNACVAVLPADWPLWGLLGLARGAVRGAGSSRDWAMVGGHGRPRGLCREGPGLERRGGKSSDEGGSRAMGPLGGEAEEVGADAGRIHESGRRRSGRKPKRGGSCEGRVRIRLEAPAAAARGAGLRQGQGQRPRPLTKACVLQPLDAAVVGGFKALGLRAGGPGRQGTRAKSHRATSSAAGRVGPKRLKGRERSCQREWPNVDVG